MELYTAYQGLIFNLFQSQWRFFFPSSTVLQLIGSPNQEGMGHGTAQEGYFIGLWEIILRGLGQGDADLLRSSLEGIEKVETRCRVFSRVKKLFPISF